MDTLAHAKNQFYLIRQIFRKRIMAD